MKMIVSGWSRGSRLAPARALPGGGSDLAVQALMPPTQVTAGGTALVRLGTGLRTGTDFGVHVYAIGLYRRRRTASAEQILAQPFPSRLVLHFLRDVPVSQLRDAWRDGVVNNIADPAGVGAELARWAATLTDLQQGQSQVVDLEDGGASLLTDGKIQIQVKSEAFARAILAAWLGPHPPTAQIKSAMLGMHS